MLKKNEFYDINKLPPEKGLILFGLSMNKLYNRQNARNCLKDLRHFSPSKISKPFVGTNFLYSDFLSLENGGEADKVKNAIMASIVDHKNAVQKRLAKNNIEFQIQHAFNFLAWNQLYLGTKDFSENFLKIKNIYDKDKKFQKYLKEDCRHFEKKPTKNQINFFLEEALMIYLLAKNQIKLPNEYIENNQRWILFCYPGRPIRTIVYLFQLNPFKLDWSESPYQNSFYDLADKKLIEMDRVDLDSYSI